MCYLPYPSEGRSESLCSQGMAIIACDECCNVSPRSPFSNEDSSPPAAGSTSDRWSSGVSSLYGMPQLKKTASPKIMPPSKGPALLTEFGATRYSSFRACHGVGWGLRWDCIIASLLLLHNAFPPPLLHKCWSQRHSLINILCTSLHLEVCFLEKPDPVTVGARSGCDDGILDLAHSLPGWRCGLHTGGRRSMDISWYKAAVQLKLSLVGGNKSATGIYHTFEKYGENSNL